MSAPSLGHREKKYVRNAIQSKWVSSSGSYIDAVELTLAKVLSVPFATTVSNGTVALQLALHIYGIGPGDEVIIPNLAFVAIPNAVLASKAKIVLVDINEEDFGLNTNAVEAAITSATKAIIMVHNYGFPSGGEVLRKIADRYGLVLIEDCAEAPFQVSKDGWTTGNVGHIATYSFYANKVITSGEGGAIASSDESIIERARFLKNHGAVASQKFYFPELAFNYRITNLQAAVLLAQMERKEELLRKRNHVFKKYQEALEGLSSLELKIPTSLAFISPWLVTIELKEAKFNTSEISRLLAQSNIDSRPLFFPFSKTDRFNCQRRGNFEVSEKAPSRFLNLPTYADLTEKSIYRIVETLSKLLRK